MSASEKTKKLTRTIALTALFTALTAAATFIKVETPVTHGHINFGDVIVLLGAFALGPVYGGIAGAVGSMLADLIMGYMLFVPATFVIKGACAVTAALIFLAFSHGAKRSLVGQIIGGLAGEAIMVIGYFAYEATLLKYGWAAAASAPLNAIQGVVGVALSIALYRSLAAIPALKKNFI